MLALVDGDFLPYSIGFASQRNEHTVFYRGDELGTFKYKREVNNLIKDLNLSKEDVSITTEIVADPESHALHSVKACLQAALEDCGADRYVVYLQGKDNFRDKLAKTLPYKSGRPSVKPIHFQAIRDYLVAHWNAEIVDNMETDDQLSIEQTKAPNNTVIITADKDLNTVAGYKYNIKKRISYYVSEEDALLWNYCQLILGDKVDAIQGIKGKGLIATYKLFQDCETEEELHWAALCAYEESSYEKPFEVYLEMMRLLFMIREQAPDGTPVMWEPYDSREGNTPRREVGRVVGWPVPAPKKISRLSF